MMLFADADDESRYALLVAVSKFVRAMSATQRDPFVSELFALGPEVALCEGSRQVARDIGAAFAPVLPSIVPYLLQVAHQDVDMVICSVSNGRIGGTFIPGQNKVLHFSVEQSRDMQRAIESLADYARATGRAFLPWVDDAVKSANYVSGIVGDCSADLRASAAKLLAAVGIAVAPESAGELADRLIELANPKIEVEIDVQARFIEAVRELAAESPDTAAVCLLEHIPRIVEVAVVALRGDIDEDDRQGYLDLLWAAAGAIKDHYPAESAVAAFHETVALLGTQFENEPVIAVTQLAAALWVDFLTQAAPAQIAECETVVQSLIAVANSDKDNDLRRMGLFGIGRIFERLTLTAAELDPILGMLFDAAQALEDDQWLEGNDCALSSFALLLRKRVKFEGADQFLSNFIQMFPVKADLDEADVAYGVLIELFVSGNPVVEQFSEPITEAIAAGMANPALTEKVGSAIQKIVAERFDGTCPPQLAVFLGQGE
jgi:hypothetical protein